MSRKYNNYYKVSIRSDRGKALTEFMRQCHEADVAADRWAQEHNAAEYIEPVHAFAGGVLAVVFDGYAPDLDVWRKIEAGDGDAYVPNVPDDFDITKARERQQNGETLTASEQLELSRMALPIMSAGHFFDVLPFRNDVAQRINISVSPMIFQRKNYWYIATPVRLQDHADIIEASSKTFYRNRLAAINER